MKKSDFIEGKVKKLWLITTIDGYLHGQLKSYVVTFKAQCKWLDEDYEHEKRIIVISRGSADNCPYRMDYPAFGGGIHRAMFSLSHFDNPWNELCRKLWELDLGEIEFMGPLITGQEAKQIVIDDPHSGLISSDS